jgi:hypothetical protein
LLVAPPFLSLSSEVVRRREGREEALNKLAFEEHTRKERE